MVDMNMLLGGVSLWTRKLWSCSQELDETSWDEAGTSPRADSRLLTKKIAANHEA
jgi:hypothetical protein